MSRSAPLPAPPGQTLLAPSPGRRRAGRGTRTGCLLVLVVMVVMAGLVGVIGVQTLQQPDLGAPPGGPLDGSSENAIARHLGLTLAAEMVRNEHASVLLSEQDLTVLARAHNPDPARLLAPQVRIRRDLLAVAAQTDLGPRTAVVVGWLAVVLDTTGDTPHLVTQIQHVDVGTITVPGWAEGLVDSRLLGVIQLDQVFRGSPALQILQRTIECLVLTPRGVQIGFHRPGAAADPTACRAGPAGF